jgi:hypothetical protein
MDTGITIDTGVIMNPIWNNEYFTEKDGLSAIYVDTNQISCSYGYAIGGVKFCKLMNRIALEILPVDYFGNNEKWTHAAINQNNKNYFPQENGLTGIYADTNPVFVPLNKIWSGVQLYQKGNRIAPRIYCTDINGQNGKWIDEPDFNDNYFPKDGDLSQIYADTNEVKCSGRNLPKGIALYKKNNRIAPLLIP